MTASLVEQASQQSSMMGRLREETRAQHQALEDGLALLTPPFERARYAHLLERFYGFHLAWEPAVARSGVADFAAPRGRLEHLRADLAALGHDPLAPVERCGEAVALARTDAHAIGSLYVIEGSSLGGQVISRALASAEWLPDAGLTYFNPYGPQTGAMWRAFREWCDAQARTHDADDILSGARETFVCLRRWLVA